MKAAGTLAILAAVAFGARAEAQAPSTSSQGSVGSAEPQYISSPEWASKPNDNDLSPYRPEHAYRDGVPGGAIVDCKAAADGTLDECKVSKAKPQGWQYEIAGPRAVSRLFKLKPTLPDVRSVKGMHVLVAVIWK